MTEPQPLCASPDVNPDWWFDEPKHSAKNAKRICERCPLKEQCLEDNLLAEFGIYGGLGQAARKRLAHERGIEWPHPYNNGCYKGKPKDWVDEEVVYRAMHGFPTRKLTRAERIEVVRQMDHYGYKIDDIMAATKVSGSSLRAIRELIQTAA